MSTSLSSGGGQLLRIDHEAPANYDGHRRGLARFLNYVVNHPIIRDDAILAAFLTENSFEQWRKHTPITLDEESTGKRVDRVEEMAIPSDLDDKLQ
jgi:sorting nexin-8